MSSFTQSPGNTFSAEFDDMASSMTSNMSQERPETPGPCTDAHRGLKRAGFNGGLDRIINRGQQGTCPPPPVLEHRVHIDVDIKGDGREAVRRHEELLTRATETLLAALSWREHQVPLFTPPAEPSLTLDLSLTVCHGNGVAQLGRLPRVTSVRERRALLCHWPLQLTVPHTLEQVNSVTELRVLGLSHHQAPISAKALSLIMKSLPHLHTVIIQRWRDMNPAHRKSETAAFEKLVDSFSRGGITSLSINESWDPEVHGHSPGAPMSPSLGKLLARVSSYMPRLRHLSATFIVDARHFFNDFLTDPMRSWPGKLPDWTCLETLSLTATELLEGDKTRIAELWEAAMKAVDHMLRLRVLELWAVGNGRACILRFSRDKDGSGIPVFTRRVTADIEFQVPAVIDMARTWGRMTYSEEWRRVEVENWQLPQPTECGPFYTSPVCMLPFLALSPQ